MGDNWGMVICVTSWSGIRREDHTVVDLVVRDFRGTINDKQMSGREIAANHLRIQSSASAAIRRDIIILNAKILPCAITARKWDIWHLAVRWSK